MRRFGILIALVLLVLIGGGLSVVLNTTDGNVLPVLTQTDAVDASPTAMAPWKANQFILLIGFIVFNLVGIAVTLAIILWFVDRGLRKSRAEALDANTSSSPEKSTA